MLSNQEKAIDNNISDLVKAAELTVPVLLCDLQICGVLSIGEREIVEKNATSAAKLFHLFGILKTKASGWSQLQSYLRTQNQSYLADKLQSDADGSTNEPNRSALAEFSLRLARYYRRYYANVPTMGQSDKHVKDVWLPLQIDGRKEDFSAADPVDHIELLNRLKSPDEPGVALIKGDPGMGKTTLAKKIAYDWAVDCESSISPQFSLVLAVPLRSAGKSTQFCQLAIDYVFAIGQGQLVNNLETKNLKKEITNLGSQLLVVLDGLDEYTNYSGSAFEDIFTRPFNISPAYSKTTPPMFTFKLIITSRPYACERIQMGLPLLRYVIAPLDGIRIDKFVQMYCQTSHGIATVAKYLKTNAQLVLQVPLILTFICYLADSDKKISSNMTSLYDSFIRQMLTREDQKDKLSESIVDTDTWKDSVVVKTTSELAFRSFTDDDYDTSEFSQLHVDKCHVTKDSYICGFLLHKLNFGQGMVNAEFPHRSIQEFFAALYCYELMLSGSVDQLNNVYHLIVNRDSLVGRFFFGICSKNQYDFDKMTRWLRPSLTPPKYDLLQPAEVINTLGTGLTDCSAKQNCIVGQKFFDSVGDLVEYVFNSGINFLGPHLFLNLHQFSDEFKKGLHVTNLSQDNQNSTTDWYLADNSAVSLVDNRKSARLVNVRNRLREFPAEKFDEIDLFIWQYSARTVSQTDFDKFKSLPIVTTLVMTTDWERNSSYTTATMVVRYGGELDLKLTRFQLSYNNKYNNKLLGFVAREPFVDLKVDDTGDCDSDGKGSGVLKVTIYEEMSQWKLIVSLIRMSLRGQERLTSPFLGLHRFTPLVESCKSQ